GLDLDESKKDLIQKGCREIVAQIVNGAQEYWLASFSDQRRAETRFLLESLVKKSAAAQILLESINEWSQISDEDLKAGWLFESLTEDLLSGNSGQASPMLESEVIESLVKARERQLSPEIDFEELSLGSKSSWDLHIRQLTPDLPTYLSD